MDMDQEPDGKKGNQTIETQELASLLEAKERECAEARDRYLRLYAEFENHKKLAQRDQLDYAKYAAEKVLRELLPVADNLARAIAHARSVNADPAVVDGLDLIARQFRTRCASRVPSRSPLSASRSTALHQALTQVETDEHESDTVVEEAQRGYLLHGRILRPALVTVARKSAPSQGDGA
jgi:molecular chaperone GrpE